MSFTPSPDRVRARPVAMIAKGALVITILATWHAHRAAAQGSPLERSVDTTVAPGDDFFGYANGAWLKATTIPGGRDHWGARDEIAALTRARLDSLFTDAARAPVGSLARKVAEFRAAWLDTATIERAGLAPLRPLLAEIAAVHDRASLTRALAHGMRADVDPLNWGIFQSSSILGLSVEPGIGGERAYVPFLVQGGLGLPDRDAYLNADTASQALRARYQTYAERLFTLAGFDHPADRARRAIALERAIAESQVGRDASAQDHRADTLWTRADFARDAPGIDWSLFFAAAGLARQGSFVPWQPSAVTGMAALVASRPIAEWQDYLRLRAIDHHAAVLPRAFAEAAAEFHADPPRAERALAATQGALGEGIGRLYAERYFSAAEKARAQRVVADVRAAFLARVEAATWMSPATKTMAVAQVKRLYIGVGYPERWQDYSDLHILPHDALGNADRAEARNYRQAVARLGRPVDRTAWWILPQVSGAILIFQQDAYDFSAALLVPPKYDPAGSDAAAYGSIGAIIGHDVSHYVDELGAEFDSLGRERPWWTPDDRAAFEARALPLVEQYSAYRPLPDVAIDGRKSMTENVADLAGLTAAFDAYRARMGDRGSDPAAVRSGDREFFIAFAQAYRNLPSDAALRAQAASDHAPERYRAATVRNLDAWYAAFDVRPGQRLYLAPADRVRVW